MASARVRYGQPPERHGMMIAMDGDPLIYGPPTVFIADADVEFAEAVAMDTLDERWRMIYPVTPDDATELAIGS